MGTKVLRRPLVDPSKTNLLPGADWLPQERNRFLDTFAGAADTPLPQHEPDLSGLAGGWRNENGGLMLSGSGSAVRDPSLATRQGDSRSVATVPAGSPEVKAQAVLSDLSGQSGLVVALSDPQNYVCVGWAPGSNAYAVYEVEGGAQSTRTVDGAFETGDTLGVEVAADTLTVLRNGEQIFTHISALLTSGARCGIYAAGAIARFSIRK